jgi:uncharacterized protein YndB with AHSA1/START domain
MKDYKKYYIVNETPDQVYLALTNPLTIMLWTGAEAEGTDIEGSDFSMMGGAIEGKILELTPGKKIVQQWYFGEQEEPSIVTILLHLQGQATSVELRHSNIPDEDFDDITDGWNNVYFADLQDFYFGK